MYMPCDAQVNNYAVVGIINEFQHKVSTI